MDDRNGNIVGVALSPRHTFSKHRISSIELIENHGVAGDAHAGTTVKHRSRVAVDPSQPNLRQVHLIHGELLDDLARQGFAIAPSELGENITTRGIDLLGLPRGTILRCGANAQLEVTGLRNPCKQIEAHSPGLLDKMVRKGPGGSIERLAGIMAVVRVGGTLMAGDPIVADLPDGPHFPLERV